MEKKVITIEELVTNINKSKEIPEVKIESGKQICYKIGPINNRCMSATKENESKYSDDSNKYIKIF